MLTPEWYETCSKRVMALFQRLEDDILRDVVRRLAKSEAVTMTAKWQIEILQEAGMVYSDIVRAVAKHKGVADEEIRKLFQDAAVQVVQADNAVAEQGGREIKLSDSIMQAMNATYQATMGNIDNLTSTTAEITQTKYIEACNQAHMQVMSGAFSYHDAIKAATAPFRCGVAVRYPTGHLDRIDVAIARAVRTGIGQAAAEISRANAEELDTDLMEITAHSGARPSHAAWQGKLVSISGDRAGQTVDGVRVLSLAEIGYGTGDGFRGWNCRHDWFPYLEGISKPNYTEEQLAKLDEKHIEWNGSLYTDYEVSQMQRAAERKIRAFKRELVCYDAAGDADAFAASSVKLAAAQKQLRTFLVETGRDRERWRERVNGYNSGISDKVMKANKKNKSGGKDTSSLFDKLAKTDDSCYKTLFDRLKNRGIEYNPVTSHRRKLSDAEIVEALSGGDNTKGSCASVGLAYIGQKQGWNVLDFRGGDSLNFFSNGRNLRLLADSDSIKTLTAEGACSLTVGKRLIDNCEPGKEYYLCVGRHASIVRRNENGVLQYLELQSAICSGWTDFAADPRVTLRKRFKCKTKSDGGFSSAIDFMIDIEDSNFKSKEFKALLGFLNTAEQEQRKSEYGSIK